MAQTSISSSSAYASPADLVVYHDWRNIADLVLDDDTRAADSATVQANAVVVEMMKVASGELEAACFVGQRYSAADLSALTGVSLSFMKKLICDIAFLKLTERRWPGTDPKDVSGAQRSLDYLKMLRQGERVFSFQETAAAALPDNVEMAPARSTAEDKRISVEAGRFFGHRRKPGN